MGVILGYIYGTQIRTKNIHIGKNIYVDNIWNVIWVFIVIEILKINTYINIMNVVCTWDYVIDILMILALNFV